MIYVKSSIGNTQTYEVKTYFIQLFHPLLIHECLLIALFILLILLSLSVHPIMQSRISLSRRSDDDAAAILLLILLEDARYHDYEDEERCL